MAVSAEDIRRYNARLNEYKKQSVELQAELGVAKREIERLCKELSEKLGKEINEENIAQVYMEYMSNLEEKISTGNGILDRIESESRTQE